MMSVWCPLSVHQGHEKRLSMNEGLMLSGCQHELYVWHPLPPSTFGALSGLGTDASAMPTMAAAECLYGVL